MPPIGLVVGIIVGLMVLVFGGTIAFGLLQQRRQKAALSGTKPVSQSGKKSAKPVEPGAAVAGEGTKPAPSRPQTGAAAASSPAVLSATLTPPFPAGGYLPEPIARGVLPPPAPTLRDVVLREVQQRGGLAPSPTPNYGEEETPQA